jgi:glycosyl transferase family 25
MSTDIGFDKTYVINLKSRQERRDKMKKTLQGLDYEIVDAIDGQKLKVRKLIKDGLLNTEYYDPNGVLTRNIIGCSLSHIKVWKKFLKSGLDTCLILEDDIFLTREIVRHTADPEFGKPRIEFQILLDEINSLDEWDVVFLGKKTQEVPGKKVTENLVIPEFGITRYGAHAYVINKNSVKKILKNYIPISYGVDIFLEDEISNLKVFSVSRSFIRQYGDLIDDANENNLIETNSPDSDTFWNLLNNGKLTTCAVDDIVESVEFINYPKSSNFKKFGDKYVVMMKLRTYG